MEQDIRRLAVKINDAIGIFEDFLSNLRPSGISFTRELIPGGMAWNIDCQYSHEPHVKLGRVELRGFRNSTLIRVHPPDVSANAALELEKLADQLRQTHNSLPLEEAQKHWNKWKEDQFSILMNLVLDWKRQWKLRSIYKKPNTASTDQEPI